MQIHIPGSCERQYEVDWRDIIKDPNTEIAKVVRTPTKKKAATPFQTRSEDDTTRASVDFEDLKLSSEDKESFINEPRSHVKRTLDFDETNTTNAGRKEATQMDNINKCQSDDEEYDENDDEHVKQLYRELTKKWSK